MAYTNNGDLVQPYVNMTVTAKTLVNVAGRTGIYYATISNTDATTISWFNAFDSATVGAVTLGTTKPTLTFSVPANGTIPWTAFDLGIPFLKGIVLAATTTAGGATPSTNPLVVNLGLGT